MGARRKEQAHTREQVEECAGKSVGRLGSFVEGFCEVGSALVAYICCLTLMSDLGAKVGAVVSWYMYGDAEEGRLSVRDSWHGDIAGYM